MFNTHHVIRTPHPLPWPRYCSWCPRDWWPSPSWWGCSLRPLHCPYLQLDHHRHQCCPGPYQGIPLRQCAESEWRGPGGLVHWGALHVPHTHGALSHRHCRGLKGNIFSPITAKQKIPHARQGAAIILEVSHFVAFCSKITPKLWMICWPLSRIE